MSDQCSYDWRAPYLHPPNIYSRSEKTYEIQTCVLPKGHDGPHRSATNVIRHQPVWLSRPDTAGDK